MDIIYRLDKGSALTHEEMDGNLKKLSDSIEALSAQADKVHVSSSTAFKTDYEIGLYEIGYDQDFSSETPELIAVIDIEIRSVSLTVNAEGTALVTDDNGLYVHDTKTYEGACSIYVKKDEDGTATLVGKIEGTDFVVDTVTSSTGKVLVIKSDNVISPTAYSFWANEIYLNESTMDNFKIAPVFSVK